MANSTRRESVAEALLDGRMVMGGSASWVLSSPVEADVARVVRVASSSDSASAATTAWA
ncbi:hypothetical protein [Streptomyces sp. NPDC002676]